MHYVLWLGSLGHVAIFLRKVLAGFIQINFKIVLPNGFDYFFEIASKRCDDFPNFCSCYHFFLTVAILALLY